MWGRDSRAGRSTRLMASRRRNSGLIYGLAGIAVLLAIMLLLCNAQALRIGGGGTLALVLIGACLVQPLTKRAVNRKTKAARRADRGAKAEERLGEILEGLGDDYYPFHDVPCPYGNIDHIVIGRYCGIVLIETKAHGGRVGVENGVLLVNGHLPEKDFVAQCLRNTFWLKETVGRATGVQP